MQSEIIQIRFSKQSALHFSPVSTNSFVTKCNKAFLIICKVEIIESLLNYFIVELLPTKNKVCVLKVSQCKASSEWNNSSTKVSRASTRRRKVRNERIDSENLSKYVKREVFYLYSRFWTFTSGTHKSDISSWIYIIRENMVFTVTNDESESRFSFACFRFGVAMTWIFGCSQLMDCLTLQ